MLFVHLRSASAVQAILGFDKVSETVWYIFSSCQPLSALIVTKLIYHMPTATAGEVSPFDAAILQVSQAGPLKVVSPYIGVGYLKRILCASQENWCLLSDVKAWLASLSVRARPQAWAFIRANLSRIHHCTAIHAKTVIGQRQAYIGSANLTSTGVLARTEMGVLLEEPALVAELHRWFDEIWSQTAPPVVDEASEYVKQLDQDALLCTGFRAAGMSLSSPGRTVRARLAKEVAFPSSVQPALDLSQVAKELVATNALEQQSLAKILLTVIGSIGDSGTSFSAVVHAVRDATAASRRDVYLALLTYCANRVRTVFAPDTINRLIYAHGVFVPSAQPLLDEALAPFDAFLAVLIHHLDFEDERPLPTDELTKHSGVRASMHAYLIRSLLQCGLLEQAKQGGFVLAEGYTWPNRFRLFSKAQAQWVAQLERQGRPDATVLPPLMPLAPIGEATPMSQVKVKPAPVIPQGLPAASVTNKPVSEANVGMSASEVQTRISRADKVYWDLVTLVSREGASLRYPSINDLAHALSIGSTERQFVIEQLLTGSFEGAPQLFTITCTKGACVVRLAASADIALKQMPNTSRALSLLGREHRAELEGLTVPHAVSGAHKSLVVDERQQLIKVADGIYAKFIELLHDKPEVIQSSVKIVDVARAVELVEGGRLADIIAVLGGRASGLPRLFKLEFVETKQGVRCKVHRLLVRDESLANLPVTRELLQNLPQRLAPYINSRIASKKRKAQPTTPPTNLTVKPSVQKNTISPAASSFKESKKVKNSHRRWSPAPEASSSGESKITLTRTEHREVEATNSVGRKSIVDVTVRKRRVVAKKDIE